VPRADPPQDGQQEQRRSSRPGGHEPTCLGFIGRSMEQRCHRLSTGSLACLRPNYPATETVQFASKLGTVPRRFFVNSKASKSSQVAIGDASFFELLAGLGQFRMRCTRPINSFEGLHR
jgi:hypothetical protein